MALTDKIKGVANTIRQQNEIYKETPKNSKTTGAVSFVLSVITAIMSYLNFAQHQYEMMAATVALTLVLACVFIFSLLVKFERIVDSMLCMVLSMLCVFFAVTGGNDGFAILWVLLIPPAMVLFMAFIYVISIGVFFEVFFVVLFWTPLNQIVSAYYSQMFMLRFPMLYTAFFALSILAKYLMAKQEITEHKYIQTIESLSLVDQLTQISNRRSFEDRLHQEWNRAIRSKEPLSVLFIDVDNFKRYNDTYGHLQGDIALKTVASVFTKALKRSTDYVARWGGEEFAILLANTHGDQAYGMADKIRQQVADTQVPLEAGGTTNITISMGLHSMVPTLDCMIADFVRCADDALYTAKHEGRNKVCRHDAQPEKPLGSSDAECSEVVV
ncbi:MAG: GGDEF domain-containing protein [Clostridiales bacterium]|nr:GGDEF domain-containing protein [Clostridiales bacterium]